MIFLCSGAAKKGDKKLSFRLASRMEGLGIAEIGTLQDLSEQQMMSEEQKRQIIFINDCRSGCVNVLTHGFKKESYLYLDVSSFISATEFNIDDFIHVEVLPTLKKKWDYSLPVETD